MNNLREYFTVKVERNRLSAQLLYNEGIDQGDIELTTESLKDFLKMNKITFGIKENVLEEVVTNFSPVKFPVVIAEGVDKVDGMDGELKYLLDLNTEVDRSEGWDFREVMRIPTVKAGDKLAQIIPPTKGENGKDVYGNIVRARPGKPIRMRAGKNVKYNETDQIFYATTEGQVNISRNSIHVHTVYEVHESISMKTGNIDFAGTVVIRGDVPTGFTVKATGDIKIFGIVEAANIVSGGSVFITEGIAGLKTGTIEAAEDVNIGYINQGNVTAGNSILVENSILHSECSAGNDIICQRGNIIGGTLSAGKSIQAKDFGNRMNTLTLLSFGVDKKLYDEQTQLETKKETLQDNLRKLNLLKERMEQEGDLNSSQNRIMLLKLRNSYNKTVEQLHEIEDQMESLNASLGEIENTYLKAMGTVYPNVIVSFGKYKRTIDRNYDNVSISILKNDITISPY